MVKYNNTLKPIVPNKGIELWYRKQLIKLIDEMQHSVEYWLKIEYKRQLPKIAQDALPANELYKEIKKLIKQWQKKFNSKSLELAKKFIMQAYNYTEAAVSTAIKMLKKEKLKADVSSMAIGFKKNPRMENVVQSFIHENVNLIKSIPQKYFTEVEGMVMRSVRDGRDLGTLTEELQKRYGITKRRAILIARDQNNKATSQLNRTRMTEIGFTRAIWVHPTGIKEPRHSHVKADGKIFDLNKGCLIDGEYIYPGELINCHCRYKTIIEDII